MNKEFLAKHKNDFYFMLLAGVLIKYLAVSLKKQKEINNIIFDVLFHHNGEIRDLQSNDDDIPFLAIPYDENAKNGPLYFGEFDIGYGRKS